jgi:hypothetical protein
MNIMNKTYYKRMDSGTGNLKGSYIAYQVQPDSIDAGSVVTGCLMRLIGFLMIVAIIIILSINI